MRTCSTPGTSGAWVRSVMHEGWNRTTGTVGNGNPKTPPPRSRAGAASPPGVHRGATDARVRGAHLEILVEADALAPVLVQRLEHVHRRGAERALAQSPSQLGRIDLPAAVGVSLVEHRLEGEDLLLVVLFGYLGQRAGHVGRRRDAAGVARTPLCVWRREGTTPFAFVNQQQRSHLLVRSSAWISGVSTSLWLESNVFQC